MMLAFVIAGCQKQEAAQTALPVPEVTVANPVEREVTNYEKFTGRTESNEKVDIRANVSGYLIKVNFQPGAEIKKGDLLFEIDPRPFQAVLAGAEAEKASADASLKLAKAEYDRARKLAAQGAGSREELDVWTAKQATSLASRQKAEATVAQAKLDLDYTKINSPITGKIGDRLVDVGNLVLGGQGNTTLLATIVSVDPMAAGFDLDENTLLQLQQKVRDGHLAGMDKEVLPIDLGLPIHDGKYPVKGTVNFVNNQIDSKTGTIRVKAEFPNPRPASGDRLLTPGMFVRLRVPVGQPKKSMLVADSALGTDQGKKFLYVVNDKNEAIRLDATTGESQDGMRVIEGVQGTSDAAPRALLASELVITKGLQRVRPGAQVDPKMSGKK